MKRITILFSLVIFSLLHLHSQDIPCSAFCVTNLYMDSLTPNLMWAQIHFEGNNEDFINYPHVSTVIDAQGDTVGMGDLWFFGQFGNTTNDYPVTVLFDSIPDAFTGTFIFRFDTTHCDLPFPCSASATQDLIDIHHVTIAPNPCREEVVLYADVPFKDLMISIFDTQGRMVRLERGFSGDIFHIQMDKLNSGLYFIQLIEGKSKHGVMKVLHIDRS